MKGILIFTILSFILVTPLISFSLEPIDGGKRNLELIAQIKNESLKIQRMPASVEPNCKDEDDCLESREVKSTSSKRD